MNTLEIVVGAKTGQQWPVTATHARPGDFLRARKDGCLALDLEALPHPQSAAEYGEALGKALFSDDIRDAFTLALSQARQEKVPLHILLHIDDPELRPLHWELLQGKFDTGWDFLSLQQDTPLSLYLPSPIDQRFPAIGRPDLRALLLVAGPEDMLLDERMKQLVDPFDVPATVKAVKDAITAALGPDCCDVLANVSGAAGRPDLPTLCSQITGQRYTLLHIVCHGRYDRLGKETRIYLPGEDGKPITATEFINQFKRIRGKFGLPHFTFLMTCESARAEAESGFGGLGQNLVRMLGMPAVLAMTQQISIDTANRLATGFYTRLAEHGEPDLALAQSLASLQGRSDVTVPAIFSRLWGQPIFMDTQGRTLVSLTASEIAGGLQRLEDEIPLRAPVLKADFETLARTLERTAQQLETLQPGELGEAAEARLREEHLAALGQANSLCAEVTETSFTALALRQPLPQYDDTPPFLGLLPFFYKDQRFFSGRSDLVKELVLMLSEHHFLAVLGRSGLGKSSLVMAGLVPALEEKEGKLELVRFTPTDDPSAQLKAALAQVSNPAKTILVADQFEEVFTLCKDKAMRGEFIDSLLAIPRPYRVVLTMRADFWGECAEYPNLQAALQAHQKNIQTMSPAELRQAMETQAAQVGLKFEEGLCSTILDDVKDEPGKMPLLQLALRLLWAHRHGRWLRADEYYQFGGVQKAIAVTANEVYGRMVPELQRLMRDIFIRLTRLDDTAQEGEARNTRQRVGLDELVPAGYDRRVIHDLVASLANERLIVTSQNAVTGRDEVEVAHEALINAWDELVAWRKEDADAIRARSEVSRDALNWAGHDRKKDYLRHQGELLENALKLLTNPRLSLNELETEYLLACQAAGSAPIPWTIEASLVFDEDYGSNSATLQLLLNRPGETTGNSRPVSGYTATKTEPVQFSLDIARLETLKDDPQAYGEYLSGRLFESPELSSAFRQALSTAAASQYSLEFDLVIGSSYKELHSLAWETLTDPESGSLLLATENVIASRYLSNPNWREVEARAKGNLRALVMVPTPGDLAEMNLAPLDPQAAWELARVAFGEDIPVDLVGSADRPAALEALVDALQGETPADILFLTCHARMIDGKVLLALDDHNHRGQWVAGDELAGRLEALYYPPRLVILSLHAGSVGDTARATAALSVRLAQAGVLVVLAMQRPLSEETAARLLPVFFQELDRDGRADRALAAARAVLRVKSRPDYWVPVLYTRLRSGRLWYVPGFDREESENTFSTLLLGIERRRTTLILGPGLSEPLLGRQNEIAERWADQYAYPREFFGSGSLAQVAQYLAINQDQSFPVYEMEKTLKENLWSRFSSAFSPEQDDEKTSLSDLISQAGAAQRRKNPLDPHRLLANLALPIYITAGQDSLLEDALAEAGRNPQVVLNPWNDLLQDTESIFDQDPSYQPTPEQPLVFHLFGTWRDPETIVLTQDNYYDLLARSGSNKIPITIRRALSDSSLMLLGFQIEDWTFPLLLRYLVSQTPGARRRLYRHVATEIPPEDRHTQRYLEDYMRSNDNMRIYWGSPTDFIQDLETRLRA